MKRCMGSVAALLMLLAASAHLASQEQVRGPRLFFGPCLGAAGIITSPAAFNADMQVIFPASGTQYFPVFSEMGIQADELFPLGESRSYLAFHQMFLVGGLDQSMPMPTVDLLFGYYTAAGIELGLGPHFAVGAPDASLRVAVSLMYSIAWTLSQRGFSIPIRLAFVPQPSYANPELYLLMGFSFEVLQ